MATPSTVNVRARAHALRVHAEHRHLDREEPERVGRDEGDTTGAGVDGQRAVEGVEMGIAPGRRGVGHRLARTPSQLRSDPVDQSLEQAGLPVAPRGGTGGDRVGDGEGGQEVERVLGAGGVGHCRDRRGILEVATGREAGQQQVVAHEIDEHGDVVGVEAHAGGDGLREHDAVVGVVAGATLAQIVQQRAHQQEIGPAHRSHVVGGARDRLEQVTVDGEAVERVALRLAAHAVPLGQVVHEQPVLVEQLDHRHHGVAAAEQGHERVAGRRRSTARAPRRLPRRSAALSARERDTEVRGIGRGPQHQRRVVGRIRVGEQGDLSVAQHQTW